MRITHEQKEKIVNAVWLNGTYESAAEVSGTTLEVIHGEMKKSPLFRKRIRKAFEESKGMLIDEARALVRDYMRGKHVKTDRNRLTAAIALLNAYEPGFKGATKVEGRIEHDVRVITAVPRPKYIELPKKSSASNKAERKKLRRLNRGEPIVEGEVKEIE